MNTKSIKAREAASELIIVRNTIILSLLIVGYFFFLKSINFASNSFTIHMVGLSLMMGGFFSLMGLLFGSMLTGSGGFFFLKKFFFFAPILFIILVGCLFLTLFYPFIFNLVSFTFFDKVGLYFASFFVSSMIAGAFMSLISEKS